MITPEPIEKYCKDHSTPCNEIFSRLDAETQSFAPKAHHMQVGPLEGAFFRMIIKSMGARRVLEFGTFTGCSSLHFALALPRDGLVTTLDRDSGAVSLAKKYWEEAGVASKVESLVGDGKITGHQIAAEIGEGRRAPYDVAFIDADKASYPEYMELAIRCLRPGGSILVDNVLWSGRVLQPKEASDQVIHAFNQRYSEDRRVESVLLPIRDGIFWFRVENP